jgi:lipoate-protein ligase A
MMFVGLTLPNLADNLALDEALLFQAETGQSADILRLWEWPALAVVLGASCRLEQDVDEPACQAENVPILRRSSGGGTVLLGRGCLLYTLVLAYDRAPPLVEIRSSYHWILDRMRAALADGVPGLDIAGTSDLAIAGRKVSGNAQQRKRRYLLHHGTLLHGFDLALVARYLRLPARQPEYRQQRAHAAFLTNLPLGPDEITRRLREAWQACTELTAWPHELMRDLAEAKYRRAEWIRRF